MLLPCGEALVGTSPGPGDPNTDEGYRNDR